MEQTNQRIAKISAHLNPPNPQEIEENGNNNGVIIRRENCRAKGGFKVAILGAASSNADENESLLVSLLHLYDVVNSPGVTADISHMDTAAVVRGFLGQAQLESAVTGMDLVLIPAGEPRKPGMTRDDLFDINTGHSAKASPSAAQDRAVVNLISNPVNSTVPIAAEVFKKEPGPTTPSASLASQCSTSLGQTLSSQKYLELIQEKLMSLLLVVIQE